MRTVTLLALLGMAAARPLDSARGQQDGTTDGSVGRSSLLLANGQLPGPEEVHVYDFINFHTHDLPKPARDEAVAFDARLLRDALPEGDTETVLQLGFRTHRVDLKDVKPVNLCIVIDRSGSMSGPNLDGVKAAMEKFLPVFDRDDILSIVIYDSEAEVLRSAAPVQDPQELLTLVRNIQSRGSTNIHAGLMLGYKEVEKNLDPKRANRVLLLSDGLANVGVTKTEEIIKDSAPYNRKGIDVTTVGIGLAYNNDLMRGLADAGRGTYHFLDSAAGIDRVFDHYLQSLLEKSARNPRVSVTLAEGVSLKAVHGYEFAMDGRTLRFSLLDMPLALTQVIPIEVRVPAAARTIATARLEYVNERTKAIVEVERTIGVRRGPGKTDADVLKNITIARIAGAVRKACEKSGRGAHDLLKDALLRAETVYGEKPEDADLKRIFDLGRGAMEIIDRALKHVGG